MAREIPTLDFNQFAALYCETQESTPEQLRERLQAAADAFEPSGFLVVRCIVLDSSWLGQRVILPYGGRATLQAPPEKPFSPRGLASDISEVEALLPIELLEPGSDD